MRATVWLWGLQLQLLRTEAGHLNTPWNDTGNASSLPAQDLEWNSHMKLDQHCVHVLTQLPISHFNRGKAQMKATFQLEAMTSSHLGGGRLAMPLLCTVSFSCAYVCFEKFNHSIPPPLKLSLSSLQGEQGPVGSPGAKGYPGRQVQ